MLRKVPGVKFVNRKVDDIKAQATIKAQKVWQNVVRGGFVLFAVGFLIWLAIFIYMIFYYAYMPTIAHTRQIHLQFKTCDDLESSVCSFPTAHIELTKRQQLLMVGQRYRISLELEMPESEANRQLGMFMVCVDMAARDTTLVGHACRSAMLHYRSPLLHTIQTLVFAPSLVFGSSEEKQKIQVEVFSDYEDDNAHPVTDVYVEIQSRRIEVYSARMVIYAHFSGLRYLMFHWPVTSAMVGVGVVLMSILFILTLSAVHLSNGGPTARATIRLAERLRAFNDELDLHDDDDVKNLDGFLKGDLSESDESENDESIEQIVWKKS